jgi:hypothetical protein
MGLQVLQGSWEEIRAHDAELIGKQVALTYFDADRPAPRDPNVSSGLYFGMFKGDEDVTEEDFKIAEWRGEDIDI